MASPRFRKLSSLAVALSCSTVLFPLTQTRADTTQPAPNSPAKPTREDALAFLQIDRVRKICEKPFTFSVTDATLEDVAIRVEKLLADSATTPKLSIEVRMAKSIRLSFEPKKSPVADILSSAADLAGAQLWIFSDHLLLAPKKALSPDEQSLLQKGMGMEAQGQSDQRDGRFLIQQQRAFTAFVSNEIKELKAASTTQSSISGDKLSEFAKMGAHTLEANTSLGQLSPNAQEMVQELFGPMRDLFLRGQPRSLLSMPQMPELALSTNTPVAVLTGKFDQLEIFLAGQDDMLVRMNWEINNSAGGFGIHYPLPKKSQPTQPVAPPLPFDPSAGQS